MEDTFKPTGPLKSSKPDTGGAALRSTPVFGIVKNNIDPVRAGRIQVYISDIGTEDPENPEGWATVSYMSPYYGFVTPKAGESGYGNFVNNPTSYGMWNSPPEIGTTVICLFINGDPNYGFYIGCVPKPEALQMVPAIGASTNIIANTKGEAEGYGGADQLPVTNINTNNPNIADGPGFLSEPKPVHSYAASIFSQQGLIRDPLRGPITTSAQRESPSRVGWGISTPGRPIYSGGYNDDNLASALANGESIDPTQLEVIARRGGHTIVMDDGDLIGKDQLVRIRSAKGHQILMSDDGQTLFIIHSNGQSYIELGKEGTIDLYSTNSYNVRTQGDINLHADNNFNIHAAKKLNIQAEEININSEKSTSHRIGTNYNIYTMGTFTHKVDGPMSMNSGGEASFASSGTTYINGSRINLNTGSTSTTPESVPSIPLVAHTDTLFDKIKGYAATPGKLQSITSRAPAHAPWANANQGVDVKTSSSASKELPSAPSQSVSKINQQSNYTPVAQPVTQSGIATVPPVTAISESLDTNATGAIVGAIAKNAATGPAAAAVSQGSAIIATAQGKTAAVGALAQTPAQMESSGILKPGSSTVINSMINSGVPVNKALTNNLFTGKPGAENLQSFVQNTQAQVTSQITNLQKAQTALTGAGVLTGKESSVAMAGVVMAGATAGVGPVIGQLQDATNNAQSLLSNQINSVGSGVSSAINAGNLAAGIAQNTMGGLGSISSAVGSMPKIEGLAGIQAASRGASAAAFTAITGAWKPLLVGVPQNLQALAKAGAALGESIASGNSNPQQISRQIGAVAAAAGGGGAVGQLSSAIGSGFSAVNAIGNARTTNQLVNATTGLLSSAGRIGGATGNKELSKTTSKITGVLQNSNSVINAVNRINNATTLGQAIQATGTALSGINRVGATLGVSSKASGLINLPGGPLSVSSIVNQALGKTALPGLPGLKQAIGSALTSTINKIPITKGVLGGNIDPVGVLTKGNSLQSLTLSGLSPGASAQLSSAISSLSSSGTTPIKLPTVGVNTFDRSELTSQLDSLLGDKRIPRPNFNAPTDESLQNLEELNRQNQALSDIRKDIAVLLTDLDAARQEYYKLESTLPKGDPALEQAKDKWNLALLTYSSAVEELNQI